MFWNIILIIHAPAPVYQYDHIDQSTNIMKLNGGNALCSVCLYASKYDCQGPWYKEALRIVVEDLCQNQNGYWPLSSSNKNFSLLVINYLQQEGSGLQGARYVSLLSFTI